MSTTEENRKSEAKCPFTGGGQGTGNQDWWPTTVDLSPLRKYSAAGNPMDEDFDYAKALWGALLKNSFKFPKEFNLYLESLGAKKPLKCHKDLWQMMYEFAITVKEVGKDYSEADAWPVFLDNFVEFMKEQGLVK